MAEITPEGSSDNERRRSVISGAQRGARVLPEKALNFGVKLKWKIRRNGMVLGRDVTLN